MSRTGRYPESIVSAFPIHARWSRPSPAKFSSSPSISASNDCNREVRVAPRSQTFSEPISLPAAGRPEGRVLGEPLGVVEVFVTSQATIDPATAGRSRSAKGNCVFFPRRESVPPRRVVRSILRTRVARRVPAPASGRRLPAAGRSEVTREPPKSTLREALKES